MLTLLSVRLLAISGIYFLHTSTRRGSGSTTSICSTVSYLISSRTTPPSPPPMTRTCFTSGFTAIGTSVSIRSPSTTRILPKSLDSSTSIRWTSLCELNSCSSIRMDSFTPSVWISENHISISLTSLLPQYIQTLDPLVLRTCHRASLFFCIHNIIDDLIRDLFPRRQHRDSRRIAHDELAADPSCRLLQHK